MRMYEGRGEAYFHSFLTSSLDMSGQLQASAALPQAKEPSVHRNLNGPPAPVWSLRGFGWYKELRLKIIQCVL